MIKSSIQLTLTNDFSMLNEFQVQTSVVKRVKASLLLRFENTFRSVSFFIYLFYITIC